MIKYELIGEDISMLRRMRRFLYGLDLDKSETEEIVVVGQVIDSLNQSIELLKDLRGEMK